MNLRTHYLGLDLSTPLVASASPRNTDIHYLRRLQAAGAGAIVLPSLFQEQVEAQRERYDAMLAAQANNSPEAQSYLPPIDNGPYGLGPQQYLSHLELAKRTLSIPVIASLNGYSVSGWTHYAALLQQAGADALELNLYDVPTDFDASGAEVEQRHLDVLQAVRAAVSIPIAVKMPPYFSAIGHMARRFVDTGANGLVLFNRFLQPDIDLARLQLSRELELSRPAEIRLPLQWIALLAGHVQTSLAASSGVESVDEVVKYLLAGADVVMTTSALLRHGPEHLSTLLDDLEAWMAARGYDSLDTWRGRMSRQQLGHAEAYTRANYIELIGQFSAGQLR